MRRYFDRYKYKSKKIIGIALGIIGALIIINLIPSKIMLFFIGIGLLLTGLLLLKIK